MREKNEIIEIKIAEIDLFIINKVREIRVAKNISQVTLSIAMSFSEGTVGRIENPKHRAKYNIRHLNLLAKALKINVTDILPPKPLKYDLVRVKIKLVRNRKNNRGEPNYEILSKEPLKD